MRKEQAGPMYLEPEAPLHPLQKHLARPLARIAVGTLFLAAPAELLIGVGGPMVKTAIWAGCAALGLEAAGSNLSADSEDVNTVANN